MGKEDGKTLIGGASELQPRQVRERMNRLVGRVIIDGLIEIDDGEYLDLIQRSILDANPQDETDKNLLLRDIPKVLLKDALSASQKAGEPPEVKAAVAKAMELTRAKMSEIVQGQYALCRHYNTISLLAAEAMDIKYALQGNPHYIHTFGKSKSLDVWEPVDPFAIVYYKNQGQSGRIFFPDACYLSPDVVTFTTTSNTSEEEVKKDRTVI